MADAGVRTIQPPLLDHLRRLMLDHAGFALQPGMDHLVEHHLAGLARRRGLAGAEQLLARVAAAPDGRLQAEIVEAMTVRETSFFRDREPFEALAAQALPGLLGPGHERRHLTLWSAGCASGQEPYSLAMLLRERFPALVDEGRARILATDISAEMIARAREGDYSLVELNRGLPAALLLAHFEQHGLRWRVRAETRRLVEAARLNLAGPWPPLPRVDVIFARYVLMYLHLDARRAILERWRRVMAPDGLLFIGATETLLGVSDAFERVQLGRAACYRPRGRPAGR